LVTVSFIVPAAASATGSSSCPCASVVPTAYVSVPFQTQTSAPATGWPELVTVTAYALLPTGTLAACATLKVPGKADQIRTAGSPIRLFQ